MCRSWLNKTIAIIIIFNAWNSRAAELLKADGGAGKTFSFPIQQHMIGGKGQSVFIGAAPGSSPNEYAFSAVNRFSNTFVPIAQKTATINKQQDVPNPLFNQGIAFLGLLEQIGNAGNTIERPVVVSSADLTRVYSITNMFNLNNIVMDQTNQLNDAQGELSSGIVGLVGVGDSQVFAAVKNNAGGNFGEPGSGIANIGYISHIRTEIINDKEQQRTEVLFEQIDASSTPTTNPQALRAAALDKTSPSIKIGTMVEAIGSPVNLCWSEQLKCLYIGLQVTANSNPGDGGRSVVLGKMQNLAALGFNQIAPDDVFIDGANNEIIGTVGANSQVLSLKTAVMYTSTRINYLITLGGNVGVPNIPNRTVYALPLVADPANFATTHGTLASKDAVPEDIFVQASTDYLAYRALKQPATSNADILKATDPAAQVGAGPVPAGDVTDMFVQSDAVFVAVGAADVNQQPGVFVSNALFDELGRIKGWTKWQRVAGTTEATFGAMFDPTFGNFITLVGANANSIMNVKRTLWSIGDVQGLADVSEVLKILYPQLDGGIQGWLDFPAATRGLVNVAWLMSTGLKKISIVESGVVVNNVLIPNGGDFSTDEQIFTDGAIGIIPPTAKVVTVSGGVLDTIGAITCAEIASSTTNSYLAVGGVHGLAVLVRPSGAGWNTVAGMSAGFQNLTSDMQFVSVGSYSFVRKLISDQNFLYVLSDSGLDRIDIAASNFATGVLVSVPLARLNDINTVGERGTFIDCLISQKLALLATNNGLFRVGNGVDIASNTIVSPADVHWTQVVLPQALSPLVELFPLSSTGLAIDLASGPGGTIYVLNGDIGLNEPSDHAYGKLMSISDQLMWRYNELLLQPSPEEIARLKTEVQAGVIHPMSVKKQIAYDIVAKYWSSNEADKAQETFEALFQNKDYSKAEPVVLPSDVANPAWIVEILKHLNAVKTSSEAKRLIESGAVSIDESQVTDFKAYIAWKPEMIVKVGKHRIYVIKA